ncbi:MAG: DUF1667 domain-containing protein [Lachnospiraceae bacterium]|nr:DUF1667 domain-containing protein [Lachnospiraceae bacterium]
METKTLTCIVCPMGCSIKVQLQGKEVLSVQGNTCPRGEAYARAEVTNPTRTVTTTVRVKDGKEMLSVKTAAPIPKEKIMDCILELKEISVNSPVSIGDVVLENVAGTGIPVVATKNIE